MSAIATELPAIARRYGNRLVVLYPRSKRPIGNDWQHGQPADLLDRHPDANLGVLCGDVDGASLAVLDVDPRHGGTHTLLELQHKHGGLPDTYRVISGGADGGVHWYFRAELGTPTFSLGPGVQVRANTSNGTPVQVVAPPSIHPETGRLYVADPSGPPWGTFAELPKRAVKLALALGEYETPRRPTDHSDALLTIHANVYVPVLTGHTIGRDHKVECPFNLRPDGRPGGEPCGPALHVYPEHERGWTCFGCGSPSWQRAWAESNKRRLTTYAGGDIITFGALLYEIEPYGDGYFEIRRRLITELLGRAT